MKPKRESARTALSPSANPPASPPTRWRSPSAPPSDARTVVLRTRDGVEVGYYQPAIATWWVRYYNRFTLADRDSVQAWREL